MLMIAARALRSYKGFSLDHPSLSQSYERPYLDCRCCQHEDYSEPAPELGHGLPTVVVELQDYAQDIVRQVDHTVRRGQPLSRRSHAPTLRGWFN